MKNFITKNISELINDESGQGMVEYGLILALIAVVVIATLTILGTNIEGIFQDIIDSITGEG